MEEKSINKCRTCLRNSITTVPLNEFVVGAKTKLTYGQLLEECARLKYSSDYERLMPQNLCTSCCQELNKAYSFIQQAQYCNNKLLNLLAKKLHKVKLENEEFEIDMYEGRKSEVNLQDTVRNQFKIVSTNVILNTVELEDIKEHEPIQLQDTNEERDDSNSSTTCATNTVTRIEITTCPICKKTINERNTLQTHMRNQHDIKALNKYINKSETINAKSGRINKKRKSIERVFKCSFCNYTARSYGAIEFHNRSKHGNEDDKFKCTFCSYTSWTKFKLFVHVKKSHRDQIKALKKAENKMNRSDTHDANGEGEEISDTNDQEKEEQSDDLFVRDILNIKKRHCNTISTDLPRRCDECGNIYKNVSSLKNHKRNVHISEEQYSVCPHCGKKFKSSVNMRLHIRTAHNPNLIKIRKKPTSQTKEKNVLCSKCSYVCCTKSLLKIHENRHHAAERPYKCDDCNKSFVAPYNLKIHRYRHTGERPYKCTFCTKRFRCTPDLIKHKRIHTNERPYKCQDCDKSFTQCYNLTLHKRTHIKAKNLKCMVCEKFFENQSLLNAHRINEGHYEEVE